MLREERAGRPMPGFLAFLAGVQAGMYTSLPAIIQSFDPAARTVTAQPAIQARLQQPDGAYVWVNLPLLVDCPVVFPSGGGITLTFPIAAGDECLIIFSCRCIDAWWQSGGFENVQADLRMHDLSDGIAIVGLSSKPQVIPSISTTNAQLRTDDGLTHVEITPGGDVGILAAGNINAVAGGNVVASAAGNVDLTAPNITLNGAVLVNGAFNVNGASTFTGTITNNGKNIGGDHVHSGSPTAPLGPISNTGQPT
jgi:phage baseplate assembly protein gpV